MLFLKLGSEAFCSSYILISKLAISGCRGSLGPGSLLGPSLGLGSLLGPGSLLGTGSLLGIPAATGWADPRLLVGLVVGSVGCWSGWVVGSLG